MITSSKSVAVCIIGICRPIAMGIVATRSNALASASGFMEALLLKLMLALKIPPGGKNYLC